MPPTTRASARRASGAPTPPRQAPPSPMLGSTIASATSVIAVTSPSQPVTSSTHQSTQSTSANQEIIAIDSSPARTALGSPITGAESDTDESFVTCPSPYQLVKSTTSSTAHSTKLLEVLAPIVNPNKSLATAGPSSLSAGTPTRRGHSEASRQGIIPHSSPFIPEQMSRIMTITSLEDIYDSNVRNQVSVLLQLHSWASVSLCHSMLMGCSRVFADADNALQKYAIEVSIPDDSDIGANSGSSQITIEKGKTPGIFSRAERQRAIAASTETAADREKASLIANAVIYKALSQLTFGFAREVKSYSPRRFITKFLMNPGPFLRSLVAYVPSKFTYKGTDRGKFQPLSFNIPGEGQFELQSINLALPYLRVSFEELRVGDYIRGRKKAPHLFEPFLKLPAEIRCMVWRFAMTPRTIELRYNYSMTRCWTLERVPVMLHVCREARYEALKRYTLAFGIRQTPDKTYFDFKRDTLFLTYEKFYGEGEYDDEIERLTYHFGQSEEAKEIESLAIDQDLLDILASRLEDEKDEWHDIGDDDMPEPELEVIPEYKSLRSLTIVKTQIDGFWDHEAGNCCDPKDGSCEARERMQQNDKAVFVSTHATAIATKTRQEYYKQLFAEVKISDLDWKVPELGYMFKRAQKRCKCGRFH